MRYGHVRNSHRAYLGVELASGLAGGAVVAQVQQGGPAARAGIKAGDVIVRIAGHKVSSATEVADVLAQLKPGQTVPVEVRRQSGGSSTVHVKLGQYPGS